MKLVAQRRERFLLFVDDLSFEEGETQYKTLKAVLEGSLEARPRNVLIYATSNRRHLIKEFFSDRNENQEVRRQDTLQEKVSLADRFGIQLAFVAPDQNEYLAIVCSMAQRRNLKVPEDELKRQALQWVQLHNARSGRTARQFVDYLTAELGTSKP
jgi:predicted AAA+ superfamily ATPase